MVGPTKNANEAPRASHGIPNRIAALIQDNVSLQDRLNSAQGEIKALKDHIESLTRPATDEDTITVRAFPSTFALPARAAIKFRINGDVLLAYLQDGNLRIYGLGPIQVLPKASNVIEIHSADL
jgi:hypothetical protein